MQIDFCIAYVGSGFHYLEHLIQNAKSLADHPENIAFRVSFHTAQDRAKLIPIQNQLASIVQAKTYEERGVMFWASANHSAAVNALAKECRGDLSIFCDFDMAFLEKGWDTKLLMASMNADLIGVAYLPVPLKLKSQKLVQLMPWLPQAQLWKYQDRPNLSFMAIKGDVLRGVFGNHLTEFDTFLANQGLPFQLVNNFVTGTATNLPAGTIWWMDTGFEIPRVMLEKGLTYTLLNHGPVAPLKSLEVTEDMSVFVTPEVFYWAEKPFIAHFKKGHSKVNKPGTYTWEQFKGDVHEVSQVPQ